MKNLVFYWLLIVFNFTVGKVQTGTRELPLVVLICSYNNAPWVEKNLESAFEQHYSNYRIIYIDDSSDDGTIQIVEKCIKKNSQHKVTLIKNPEHYWKLKNIYNAIHELCEDHEIVVQLDGDDWFAHPYVLQEINQTYQNQNIWLTWGQFITTEGKQGWARKPPAQIQKTRTFRKWRWVYANPRTFYAWLFKLIYLEDLLVNDIAGWESQFYPVSNDLAMMFPMLEMAHNHIAFIPRMAFIRNDENPLSTSYKGNELRSLQQLMHNEHVAKPIMYKALQEPIINKHAEYEKTQVDILIFSEHRSTLLSALLTSIKVNMQNIRQITVFCECYTLDQVQEYKAIKGQFKDIKCINLWGQKPLKIYNYIKNFSADYIIIAHDRIIVDRPIDAAASVRALEKTGAKGFFYSISPELLDTKSVSYQHIIGDLYAWKFSDVSALDRLNNVFVLYRKENLVEELKRLQEPTLAGLSTIVRNLTSNPYQVGLFYHESKVTII